MAKEKVHCPECNVLLALGPSVMPGKSIKCPKCGSPFVVPEPGMGHEPVRDMDEMPVRRSRRFKQKKQQGMPAGVLVSIVAALLLVIGGGAGLGIYLYKKKPGGTGVVRLPDVMPAAGQGTKVGQLTLEIEGEDLDGKLFKLSDYRGKVVVLDFWGNW